MKIRHVLIPFALLAATALAQAQTQQIWRCGNTYTNDRAEAQAKGCKPIEGGNVTIVQGTKVARPASAPVGAGDKRVSSDEQKARDAEARSILEAELKKAQARRDEIAKEYNNGEPEKMGPEHKNYQKYLDRVAELKAALERADQDVAGLQRELARVSGGSQPANPAAK
jgi:hypothetical protein